MTWAKLPVVLLPVGMVLPCLPLSRIRMTLATSVVCAAFLSLGWDTQGQETSGTYDLQKCQERGRRSYWLGRQYLVFRNELKRLNVYVSPLWLKKKKVSRLPSVGYWTLSMSSYFYVTLSTLWDSNWLL